jgi:Holliday junction resolvase
MVTGCTYTHINLVAMESQIQRKIKLKLEKAGWLVVKVIQCSAPGFPDLVALKQGKAIFLEIKRPGEKPRPLQEYRHEQLRKQNFEVIVATHQNEITHLL